MNSRVMRLKILRKYLYEAWCLQVHKITFYQQVYLVHKIHPNCWMYTNRYIIKYFINYIVLYYIYLLFSAMF